MDAPRRFLGRRRAPARRSASGSSSTTCRGNPALTGLATLAYTFGLRHAFDADHIAAIDNTTRKLLQDGERPLGTGFFFSLGHSTIVFSLTALLAVAFETMHSTLPTLQTYGSTIGASVSGTFLC